MAVGCARAHLLNSSDGELHNMVGSIMVDITKLAVCHGDVSVGMKSLASVAEMNFEVFFFFNGWGGVGKAKNLWGWANHC